MTDADVAAPPDVEPGAGPSGEETEVAGRWRGLASRFAGPAVMAAAYGKLLSNFTPRLVLTRTLTTGGDTGSHHYISKAAARFFPWSLTGWATGWFAGMPMLTFYFPLPYLLIWVLEKAVGYDVAFKVVTVLGSFLLPVCAWAMLRLLGAPRLSAVLAPAAAIAFLWIEGRGITQGTDIFGGFITSTLAGEFSYSLGLSLVLLNVGLLYRATRSCDDGLPWGRMAGCGALIAVNALCHMLPMTVLGLAAPALVLGTTRRQVLRRAVVVALAAGLGAGLVAFWLVPALARRHWTAGGEWTNYYGIAWQPRLLAALALGTLALAAWKRRPGPFLLAWVAAGADAIFLLAPAGEIVNGRFLPFVYVTLLLLVAWGFGEALTALPWDRDTRWAREGLAVVIAVAMAAATVTTSTKVAGWTTANYNGFERSQAWPELRALMDTIERLPPGRVAWEYNPDLVRFGTTRTLENIPFFTSKDTMEGLLIESAGSAPFTFWMQSEYSQVASGAVPGISYPGLDPAEAVENLRRFACRFFVAETDVAKDGFAAQPGVTLFTSSGRFNVYEIDEAPLVSVPAYRPAVLRLHKAADWRAEALRWIGGRGDDVAVVLLPPGAPEGRGLRGLPRTASVSRPPRRPTNGALAVKAKLGRTDIRFRTTAVGEPHIVAVSYFPNWHVEGAEGPYMVTPSLMLVIPTGPEVRLYYGPTGLDAAAYGISLVAFAALLALLFLARRRRRPGDAGDVTPP